MRRLHNLTVWMGVVLFLCSAVAGCSAEPAEQHEEEGFEAPSAFATPVVTVIGTPAGSACTAQAAGAALVTDLDVRPAPSLREPGPREWFVDPTFGTCLVRVTDRTKDLSADDASTGMVNEYARVQSFNADGSRLLAYSNDGWWYLYDAQTLEPLGELPLGIEPRWDAEDPALIYYNDEMRLMSYNVASGATAEIHNFAGDFPDQDLAAVWTKFEGRPSRDRRYWGLMAEDQEWLPVAFVVYDRLADRATIRDMRGVPGVEDDVDHVTVSPLGT